MREGYVKFEDRYKLQVPIEQTERGTLWSGQDTKLARKVAVAVVETDAPEALRERFAEQMGKLAALRHANIARVLEVGRTEEDAPFASMEVAEGDTLGKRMREGPAMRVDQAVRMIADVCGALSALHAAGIAHGDVHPGNVMVKELGGRVTPKLVGLGLNGAEQRRGGEDAEELLALAYMAPAQARGEVLADAASDVYSTAAMVFSLLTGRLPHRGDSAEALRAAVKGRPAPSAADVRAELAGPIAEVLDAALSPDPAKRFDTADALAKALRAALIRTRTPGALETVVGARVIEADESDEQLAAKRDEKKVATPAARAGAAFPKPGAPKALPPAKALPSKAAAKEAAPPVSSATAPLAVAEANVDAAPSEAEPAREAASAEPVSPPEGDESLEFERLSGLLEVGEVFAGGAPPPRPPPPPKEAAKEAAPAVRKDDSLEFERLSGLLEIGKLESEAPPPPPAPASAASAAGEAAETGETDGDDRASADDGAPDEAAASAAAESEDAPAVVAAPVELDAASKGSGDHEPKAPKAAAPPPSAAIPSAAAKRAPAPAAAKTSAPAPKKEAAVSEVFEAEEIAGMSSGPPPWIWAAVGVGLAAAIVVGVVVLANGDEPSAESALAEPPTDEAAADPAEPVESGEDLTATAAPLPADPSPIEPAQPAVPEAEPVEETPAQVTLTLTGVPAGATVMVDGLAVEGTELALAASDAARTIAVRLAGHEDWSRSVPGDSSADVQVDLVEIAEVAEAEEEARPEPRASPRRPSRTERARAQRTRAERGRASRTERARPERARTERARTERARTERARTDRARAQPARTTRRPGSRPTAVSDPGF